MCTFNCKLVRELYRMYIASYKALHYNRDDYYKFSEMIGQKPSIAIQSLDLIGHPYIAIKR